MSGFGFLDASLRQAQAVEDVAGRPWPLPDEPWFQGQTWEDVVVAHWRVDLAARGRLVPPELAVDTFDGEAWLGIVARRVTNLRLRGLPPLPGLSSYPELTVRTYVTLDDRPGLWFFSLDTPSRLVVEAGKRFYRLPYERARLTAESDGDELRYGLERPDATFAVSCRGRGRLFTPEPDTLEHFLTGRYCHYTADGGRLYRAGLHGRPWRLRRGSGAVTANTVAPMALGEAEPELLVADRRDVVAWPLEEL